MSNSTRVSDDSNFTIMGNASELDPVSQKLEASLRTLEHKAKRFKEIFDTAADGIVLFDEKGNVESLNPAAIKIFGLTEEKRINLKITTLLPRSGACNLQGMCSFMESLKQNKSAQYEVIYRRDDGSHVPLEFVLNSIEHDGRYSFSGIVRDLSRGKALESQLAQAQKLESVGQLAAGIAHELNTPIQFVGDNTRFLKESFHAIEEILQCIDHALDEHAEDEAIQEIFKPVREAYQSHDIAFVREEIPMAIDQTLQGAENVARIVRAMKVFSHPGTRELQAVDLNNLLESTITVSRNEWKYYALVETQFAKDLPKILCYPGELNQVFLNLIVNGAHAIQSRKLDSLGTIKIQTRISGNLALIDFEDTGTGIPETIRDRVFDPFFTTKGVGKGTGQGLAICYNIIVKLHGGRIEFDSVEGKGTVFHVTLPIEPVVSDRSTSKLLES